MTTASIHEPLKIFQIKIIMVVIIIKVQQILENTSGGKWTWKNNRKCKERNITYKENEMEI